MIDRLQLTMEVETHIGVPAAERKAPQRLVVSLEMAIDAAAVAAADDPAAGIDYAVLAADLHALASQERKTIERFAEDAAQMMLEKHRARRIHVTVRKFPTAIGLKEAVIMIERTSA